MNNFIGLEGHSFSGKTTLLRLLEKSCDVKVIEEHDFYAGGAENFPSIKFCNDKEMIDDVEFFIDLEKARCKDAQLMYMKYHQPIIMDRTLISVILFHKFIRDNMHGWIDGYKYAIRRYNEEISNGTVFIPSRIIYMEPMDNKTFARRSSRGVSVDFYKTKTAFKFMKDHYHQWINLFQDASTLVLYSQDGMEYKKKSVNQSLNFIKNNPIYTETKYLINSYVEKYT